MLTLMRIHCPHCGIEGQIVMPTSGTIVIGPCPECHRLVAIFAGNALPLDDAVMNKGSMEQKYNHLMEVLTAYADDCIRQCFSIPQDASFLPAKREPQKQMQQAGPITDYEFHQFVKKELKQLDDPSFFNV